MSKLKPCPFCGIEPMTFNQTGLIICAYSMCGVNPESKGEEDWNKRITDRLTEENAELREHLANLVTESIALAQFKNDTLRKGICSTDLDEPEWHDYQTIGEAGAFLNNLLNK